MVKNIHIDLDDEQIYQRFDSDNMLKHIRNFPRLCSQAWQLAETFHLPEDYQRINKILILGMGGSAIGGDLIAGLAINEVAVPIIVCRDYILPNFVDAETLVIASSYSGMTEETLSAFEQACETPAKKLAITTGGKLKSLCEKLGIPFFVFDYQSSPRAALPFSFFLLLGLLQNLRVFQDKTSDVKAAVDDLDTLASEINENVLKQFNKAKILATKLYNRLPVIYGGGITGPVAQRWKTQINENSKTMAFYEIFSELNHNAIMGYRLPDLVKEAVVIMLDSELLHERIRLRYEITQGLLKEAKIPYEVLKAEGSSVLSQMLGMVLMGDYVSYYLAMLNGVDPTEITAINHLKNKLAQR